MATANAGLFVWHEHLTRDPAAAIRFYTDVAGWKTQPFGQGSDYVMWVGSQGPLGGVMALPDELAKANVPPHWFAHVWTEDVDATAALALELGGRILEGPQDIPEVGRFAAMTDPQGAAFSAFRSARADWPAHDSTRAGEFCWNELVTTDATAAFRFYSELFGWRTIQEMDMGPALGTYRVFGVGDRQLGGMMNASEGTPAPPMWRFYVETADLEGAVARARAQGAKVLNGPADVPGGRMAQLLDPQGAQFALHHLARR